MPMPVDQRARLTVSDLRSLLADRRLRLQRVHGDRENVHVFVWRLVALAEARFGWAADLEEQVDQLVEEAGGRRLAMIDPWRWGPNLLRGLTRRPLPPDEHIYALPARLLPRGDDEGDVLPPGNRGP
jgi:hypothetical protein